MKFSELFNMRLPFWNIHFSRYMGTKTAIIYRETDVHINIFWFLSYHPEDTRQAPQRIVDDSNEISILFVKPKGFNKNLQDHLLELIGKEDRKETIWKL